MLPAVAGTQWVLHNCCHSLAPNSPASPSQHQERYLPRAPWRGWQSFPRGLGTELGLHAPVLHSRVRSCLNPLALPRLAPDIVNHILHGNGCSVESSHLPWEVADPPMGQGKCGTSRLRREAQSCWRGPSPGLPPPGGTVQSLLHLVEGQLMTACPYSSGQPVATAPLPSPKHAPSVLRQSVAGPRSLPHGKD